jgi:hypothetical protein
MRWALSLRLQIVDDDPGRVAPYPSMQLGESTGGKASASTTSPVASAGSAILAVATGLSEY